MRTGSVVIQVCSGFFPLGIGSMAEQRNSQLTFSYFLLLACYPLCPAFSAVFPDTRGCRKATAQPALRFFPKLTRTYPDEKFNICHVLRSSSTLLVNSGICGGVVLATLAVLGVCISLRVPSLRALYALPTRSLRAPRTLHLIENGSPTWHLMTFAPRRDLQ